MTPPMDMNRQQAKYAVKQAQRLMQPMLDITCNATNEMASKHKQYVKGNTQQKKRNMEEAWRQGKEIKGGTRNPQRRFPARSW